MQLLHINTYILCKFFDWTCATLLVSLFILETEHMLLSFHIFFLKLMKDNFLRFSFYIKNIIKHRCTISKEKMQNDERKQLNLWFSLLHLSSNYPYLWYAKNNIMTLMTQSNVLYEVMQRVRNWELAMLQK